MDFLPLPHEVLPREGVFHICWDTPVVLGRNTVPGALLWAQMLQAEVRSACGLELKILRGEAPAGAFVLSGSDELPADHYQISVSPESVCVTGGSDEALLHGVTTLCQWIRRHGALLPCLEIRDWPDLPHRGYYLDCSRGRIPTLDSLKKTVDLLVKYKINEFQLYVEHTYLFRNLSEAWRNDDPLEAEEILELDAYCRDRHVELVPSLATFGHMFQILSTKSFADLCELPDSDRMPDTFHNAMAHHTINATDPKALELVKGLIREYSALFTSRKFNICCDETFDLGKGRSAEAAAREGAQNIYVRYLGELCRWLQEQGLTPVYWGDILAKEPGSYDALPKGGICLNWGYSPDYPEDEIRALAEMGAVQYACPGLNSWSHLIPVIRDGFSNIRTMCRHAHRYGAIGLLNTDWGDYGHVSAQEFALPGILCGAAFSWNRQELPLEEMNDAISFLAYGDRSGGFMRAFTELSGNESFQWSHAMRWAQSAGVEREHVLQAQLPRMRTGKEANRRLEAAAEALDRAVPALSVEMRDVAMLLHVAAAGEHLLNEIGLYLAARDAGEAPEADPWELAARLEKWFHVYGALWAETSRPTALARTRSAVNAMADALRG